MNSPQDNEARLDQALADSFPASDPPGHLRGEAHAPTSARDAWSAIDTLDAAAFGRHLTTGAHLAWGHASTDGKDECERWLAGWLGGMRKVEHTITREWNTGDAVVLEADMACERLDGHAATIKTAVILRPAQPPFDDVRVYADLSPLVANTR